MSKFWLISGEGWWLLYRALYNPDYARSDGGSTNNFTAPSPTPRDALFALEYDQNRSNRAYTICLAGIRNHNEALRSSKFHVLVQSAQCNWRHPQDGRQLFYSTLEQIAWTMVRPESRAWRGNTVYCRSCRRGAKQPSHCQSSSVVVYDSLILVSQANAGSILDSLAITMGHSSRKDYHYVSLPTSSLYADTLVARAACSDISCVLETNIELLPPTVEDDISSAAEIINYIRSRFDVLGTGTIEHYLQCSPSFAVDANSQTSFCSASSEFPFV